MILSDDSNSNRFLIFFMTLAGFGLVSIPITWFVSDKRKEEERSNSQSYTVINDNENLSSPQEPSQSVLNLKDSLGAA